MNITFHPNRVRSREHIAVADRYRIISQRAEELESHSLEQDNQPLKDFHDGADTVAARIRVDDTTFHLGYAEQNGRLDVHSVTEGEQTTRTEQKLQRQGGGTSLSFSESTESSVTTETFQKNWDGSITYSVESAEPPEVATTSLSEATFTPGAVESLQGIVASETFQHMQSRFSALDDLAQGFDGNVSSDFNESAGILATVDLDVSADFALDEARYGSSPLANSELREQFKEKAVGGFQSKPTISGYVDQEAEVDAKLDWTMESYGTQIGAHYEYHLSKDRSSGSMVGKAKSRESEFEERSEFQMDTNGDITVKRETQSSGKQLRPDPSLGH